MHTLKEYIKQELEQIDIVDNAEHNPTTKNYNLGQTELLQYLLKKLQNYSSANQNQIQAWVLGAHTETQRILEFIKTSQD